VSAEQVPDVLFRAADRVQFQGWTRQWYARTAEEVRVRSDDPQAVAWCARGALKVESPSQYRYGRAYDALDRYLRETGQGAGVMTWNDAPGRTAGEVADTMRHAAKALLEREAGAA
jgi:hypothetical protein